MTTAGVYGRQSRGKEKSIREQVEACTLDAVEQGWTVVATHRDRTSASRYRTKEREEWGAVVAAVADHTFDVLVLWSSSRGDRDLTSWSGLLDAARRSGVLIRITDDERTYDVRKSGDWQALAQQGVGNAVDSDKISDNVKRGLLGSAKLGRPAHGRCPFGFRRRYDPLTGDLLGQEPEPNAAAIVREIFARVAAAVPVITIANDMQERMVARPEAGQWHRERVRDIIRNPAYIGIRVHNGQEYPATWAPLVEPTVFYAARAVLADPKRHVSRPGRQVHLLSYLAVCGQCEGPLCAVRGRYRCLTGSCVSIVQEDTDKLIVEAVLARLRSPQIYRALAQAGENADREAVAAREEEGRLTETLKGWRKSAAKGQTSPESLADIEAELTVQITAARRRAERADVPPALRAVLEPGEDVAVRWAALTLPAKRAVVRRLIDVLSVGPATLPGSRTFEPARFDGSRWRGESKTWGTRNTPGRSRAA